MNRTAYANVAGKYQDVLALEQSVAELHQLFQDFALLTDQQGELLDQIEFNVKEAADHVEDANVEVYESIELQKSIRKKQWYAYEFCISSFMLFMTYVQFNMIKLIFQFVFLQLHHYYRHSCDNNPSFLNANYSIVIFLHCNEYPSLSFMLIMVICRFVEAESRL